jgi:hypothetical protein
MLIITKGYGTESTGQLSGTINLQNNRWQLIAIPVQDVKVKEYFVDRLADKYGLQPEEMIEICNAFFGSDNLFRSYIPGVTNPDSANNFPLVYNDNGSLEVTGFWVKMKDLTGLVPDVNDIVFEWSTD